MLSYADIDDRLFFFFFNDTATTEIYTLSLHDALPISGTRARGLAPGGPPAPGVRARGTRAGPDRKSTRLNSSHLGISYAVFCLKKKKKIHPIALASPSAAPPFAVTLRTNADSIHLHSA